MVKEKQIRSKQHNILMCVMKRTEDSHTVLEVKQGKKTEYIPLESLIELINDFAKDTGKKLYIKQR